MKVVITDGTGLIGRALTAYLTAEGHEVVLFSRGGGTTGLPSGSRTVIWPGDRVFSAGEEWLRELDGAAAVINLAGESIAARRWNSGQKKLILESRVQTTRNLVQGMSLVKEPPPVLLSASASGYYGSRGDTELSEDAGPGDDFLARVCRTWEDEAGKATELGVRVVLLRTCGVLDSQAGALPPMVRPFRYFLGGKLGSGEQWFFWIHIADMVRLTVFLMHNEDARGPVNCGCPEPMRNRDLCRAMARILHRPCLVPAPVGVLRLALGEMADGLLLTSQRVIPERVRQWGFEFRYEKLDAALQNLPG